MLLRLCPKYCNCTCSCFGQSRHRNNYEVIYETETDSGANETEESFGQDMCGICLEEMINTEDLYRAHCKHKFHKACLERWLKEGNRCPLCNEQVEHPPADETRIPVVIVAPAGFQVPAVLHYRWIWP